jgi:hypothetical protein
MKRLVLGLAMAGLACSSAFAQTGTTTPTAPRTTAAPAASLPAGAPMPPYTFEPGPRQGDFEAFVAGSGASTDQFDGNAIGAEASFAWYALKWLPVGVRQNAAFAFGEEVSDRWTFATRAFVDFQYNDGNWFQPFIGIGLGYIYGRQVDQSGVFGPEAGFKAYVNESTFIQVRANWDWKFTADNNSDFEDGDMLYSIGAGFNF